MKLRFTRNRIQCRIVLGSSPEERWKKLYVEIFFIYFNTLKYLSYFLSVCNGNRVERLFRRRTRMLQMEMCVRLLPFCFLLTMVGTQLFSRSFFDATDLKSNLGKTEGNSRKERHGRNLNKNKLKSKELDSRIKIVKTTPKKYYTHLLGFTACRPRTAIYVSPSFSSEQFHVKDARNKSAVMGYALCRLYN